MVLTRTPCTPSSETHTHYIIIYITLLYITLLYTLLYYIYIYIYINYNTPVLCHLVHSALIRSAILRRCTYNIIRNFMSSCQYLLPQYSEGSSTDIWTECHWGWSLPECFLRPRRFFYIPLLFREMAVEHRNELPVPGVKPGLLAWRAEALPTRTH